MEEWRRLTELYGEMGEVEIRELADQINDLTPDAQQVLRDELKKRGISPTSPFSTAFPASPKYVRDGRTIIDSVPASAELPERDDQDANDSAVDYTWKTPLCACKDLREASAIARVLKGAGLESWIDAPKPYYSDPTGPRVMVAADQLEQGREVLSKPIPQEILDDLDAEASSPTYVLPVCPKCGAADPTLESVESSNNWLCESCGNSWSDQVDDAEDPRASP